MYKINNIGSFAFFDRITGEKVFEFDSPVEPIKPPPMVNNFDLHIKNDLSFNGNIGCFELEGTLDEEYINKLITPPEDILFKTILNGSHQVKEQIKIHKKKRINKKWAKFYGYKYKSVPVSITFDKCKLNIDGDIEFLANT